MSEQVSLLRFLIGNEIYEVRLNVDDSLLASLPPDASPKERKELISEIALSKIKISLEQLAPLVDIKEPEKANLSTLVKTEKLLEVDEELRHKSTEIALEKLQISRNAKSATASSSKHPTDMEGLKAKWLEDPDIQKATDPLFEDKLLNLSTAQQKNRVMKMILADFSNALSTPEALCDMPVSDWIYMVDLIKKLDISLSSQDALFLLVKQLKKNIKFIAQINFLFSLGITKEISERGELKEEFHTIKMSPFFEAASKKEIEKYHTRHESDTGLDKIFLDNEGLLTTRLSSQHALFLATIKDLSDLNEEDLESLKLEGAVKTEDSINFSQTWTTIEDDRLDPMKIFGPGSYTFLDAYMNLLQDYAEKKQQFDTFSAGSGLSPTIEIENLKFSGRELDSIFADGITTNQLYTVLSTLYQTKREILKYSTIDEAAADIFTNYETYNGSPKSYIISIQELKFSFEDIKAIDGPKTQEAIKEHIIKKANSIYQTLVTDVIKEIERDWPVSYTVGGKFKTHRDLLAALNAAKSKEPPKRGIIATEEEVARSFELRKNLIEKELGMEAYSIDQKIAALQLLYQATPPNLSSSSMASYFAKNPISLAQTIDFKKIPYSFFLNIHLITSESGIKIYHKYSHTTYDMTPQEVEGETVAFFDLYDSVIDTKIIREIDKESGRVRTQLCTESSKLANNSLMTSVEIFRLSKALGYNALNNTIFVL